MSTVALLATTLAMLAVMIVVVIIVVVVSVARGASWHQNHRGLHRC